MPKVVSANAGETLCSIARARGFKDCDPLRAEGANSGLLKGVLSAGDKVTVPDLKKKNAKKGTGKLHKFVLDSSGRQSIRLVHGSSNRPYRNDPSLARLHICNYRTDKGGANGNTAFPSGYGYHADGHADPDAFKIEVKDPDAGASVVVDLEALKPIYDAKGKLSRHESFGAANRKVSVTCEKVANGSVLYRSKYLRLVSDEQDKATLPDQTLLVTDAADGNNTGNDKIEILEQAVRASFTLPTCPAAAPDQCKEVVELPVGEAAKKRIKLCFHVFRATPGGAVVGGVTEQMLRRRTFKWFRRAYAQAGLAPRVVAPGIRFLDPPASNMLVICQDHGRAASGKDGSGDASTLCFKLGSPPSGGFFGSIFDAIKRWLDPEIEVTLGAGATPAQVGQAISTGLPAEYTAEVSTNARAFNAANGSCDVIIKKTDGERVMIHGETSSDTHMTVDVARVDINRVYSQDASFNSIMASTMEFRRVIRAGGGQDDRLDCFVVGAFSRAGLRGRAFVPARDLAAAFRPPSPLRWAAVMATTSSSGAVMDGGDNLPFTFPHEAGHVLNDAFHTSNTDPLGPTELMSGAGTSAANSVNATKRICDDPLSVSYAKFDPAQPTPGAAHRVGISAVDRFRVKGAPVMEGW